MSADLHIAADQAVATGQVAEAISLLERGMADTPADFAGWMKLAALRRSVGSIGAALDAANAALDARPNDFMALLLKGTLCEQLGDAPLAAEMYRAVLFQAGQAPSLPPPVAARLERIRGFLARFRGELESRMRATQELDATHRDRAARFVDNVLDRRPVHHQEPTHYRFPGLPDVEFFDDAYGDVKDRLRAAYPAILDEFNGLMARHADRQRPYVNFAPGEPVAQWSKLNRSPAWNALHLLRYGEPDPINAAACPQTIEAFAGPAQADVPRVGPNLMFSLLAPGAHIPSHHGIANFRVVCHLPLIVPENCRFRVGADTRPWHAGEPWVFDDTIEHEGWNDSDALRVVLIGDLWRPELDEQDRMIVRDFMAAQTGGSITGAL